MSLNQNKIVNSIVKLTSFRKSKFLSLFLSLVVLLSGFLLAEEKSPVLPTEEVKQTQDGTGALITINLQDADIRGVLHLISTYANINIVADPEVTGEVTIALKNVSWERALRLILDMHKWTSLREENVIRVTTAKKLKEEMEAAALKKEMESAILKKKMEAVALKKEMDATILKKEIETAILETRTFFFNFAMASEMEKSIKGALSERGKVSINEQANALVITDVPAHIAKIEKVIGELSAETAQIIIEAKMLEVTLGDEKDTGIDWNVVGGITRGAIRPTTFPFEADRGLGDFTTRPGAGFALGEVFPIMGAADFTFGVLSAEAFRAVLHLLETRTDTRTLSAPNITTLSNREARILTGTRHPIPTMTFNEERGAWEVTGHEFIDVGILLTVTPRAGPGENIIMKVKPVVSEVLKEITFLGGLTVPVLRTKEAETEVTVKDGETLVIGGLMETTEKKTVSRVPLLGHIPLLGLLFRKEKKEDVSAELLIFITAHLVKEQKLSDYQKARLQEIEVSWQIEERKRMAEGHYLAGKRFLLRGDYKSAAGEFKKALNLDPGHQEANRLLRRAESRLRMKEM